MIVCRENPINEVAVSMKSDAEWQAESDLNTLIEAEKIKKDKKRLKDVMARKMVVAAALATMVYKASHMKAKPKMKAYA